MEVNIGQCLNISFYQTQKKTFIDDKKTKMNLLREVKSKK